LKGRLRFNHEPSGSHAKLLLWDGTSGWRACVGSYNWLSSVSDTATRDRVGNLSVSVSEGAGISALARCAAGLWSGADSAILESTGDRWRRVASELDRSASSLARGTPSNATMRLVLDREHETLLREWCRTAQTRLLVASHRCGPASESRLISAEV